MKRLMASTCLVAWAPCAFAQGVPAGPPFFALNAYDLARDFGAKCDGSNDDTAAIQRWLNKAAAGVLLTAPAGTCLFSSPVSTPGGTGYAIKGAGQLATTFQYNGAGGSTAETATAGAAWSASDTSITLSAPDSGWIAANVGYNISVWDYTTAAAPFFVGYVQGINGTTVNLKTPYAVFASSGSADSLRFSVDLFTLNIANQTGINGGQISDFRIRSTNALTGGYGLTINQAHFLALTNVTLDGTDGSSGNGNLCGGIWANGGGVTATNVNAYSRQDGCADGALVNGEGGSTALFTIVSGRIGGGKTSNVISGFRNGVHLAGNFGGFRCDTANIANNDGGILIDQSVQAVANREWDEGSTCALDNNRDYGVKINDSGDGGPADIAGWIASTQQGPGIDLEQGSGKVVLRGENIYNNCGDGVYLNNSNFLVVADPTTMIYNNGASLDSYCTTWQGSNSSAGWGLRSTVSNASSNMYATFTGNLKGAMTTSNGNQAVAGFGVTNSEPAFFNVYSPSGQDARVKYGTALNAILWNTGKDGPGAYCIGDATNGGTCALHVAAGGNVTLGEAATNTLAGPVGSIQQTIGSIGIPFIIPSSGSMANNGALTMTTALNRTYANAYFYMPANAISSGSTAGWYYGVGGSTTTATLYNNTYTSGIPAIPGSPTAFVTTGPGAYTQTTGSAITSVSYTVAANTLGIRDSIRVTAFFAYPNSAGTKSFAALYGSGTFGTGSATTTVSYGGLWGFHNAGVTSAQAPMTSGGSSFGLNSSGTLPNWMSVDSTSSQSITNTMQLSSASDYVILAGWTVEYVPSP